MPAINIADAEIEHPETGEKVHVKVLEAQSVDGLTVQIILPEKAAQQVSDGLSANPGGIQVATAADMPPEPPNGN